MPFNLNKDIDKTTFVLDLIAAKQEVISENLANVNTPGYVRKDINFEKYLGEYAKPLETDLSVKMGSVSLARQGKKEVNVAEELVQLQKNALFYSVATRKMSKVFEELKTVTQIGR